MFKQLYFYDNCGLQFSFLKVKQFSEIGLYNTVGFLQRRNFRYKGISFYLIKLNENIFYELFILFFQKIIPLLFL